jgi:hypothetical protein
MTLNAVRPRRKTGARKPTTHVLGVRNGLKMIGVDAVTYPTAMVNLEAIRHLADIESVRHTMGQFRGAINLEPPVAIRIGLAAPDPTVARIRFDKLTPESLREIH